ncbi:unnamed protein product [Rhizoctonia solani]|uniref:Uncharacterized protein n=1 Tax=Rhizoctonia solani TaxID=456999 RepID=A0A8H3DX23_9AGAM|nr:unnamed protein product [Rhizoctonia solani]
MPGAWETTAMSRLPLAQLASASTPGASPYFHNKLIITKRAALGLEALVRIPLAGAQEEAEPFFDWCQRHPNSSIQLMQLRKERVAPFFHEYVTFRLKDGSGSFRIDRRQRRDILSPMKCTEETGSEAFDTIEEVVDMEDSMYNPSDCLVHIDFTADVHLCLITDFCMAMSRHERARVYTVQRYNCYFYAQSMILYVLCWAHGWTEDHIWLKHTESTKNIDNPVPDTNNVAIRQTPLDALERHSGMTIRISEKRPEMYYRHDGNATDSDSPLPSDGDRPSFRREFWTIIRALRGKPMDSPPGSMQESSIGDLQKYLSEFIYAHSIRVEEHKALLKCDARDVEHDIKETIDQLWERSMYRVPMMLRWKQVDDEIWYKPLAKTRGVFGFT